MVLAYVLSSICGGIVVNKFGYYKPLLITSSVLMAVGAGLISVLKPDSGPAAWIGFQILYGTGLGFGADLPLVAAQAVLSQDDIPKATALLILFQTLSATLFISVCDSIFIDRLSFRLQDMLPSFDKRMLVETGAVSLISRYEAKDNTLFLGAYNEALADAFIVSVVLASTTILGSLIIENRSVKTRL
jgi:MFS family permease